MSRRVSPQGRLRISGHSLVVTVPADITHKLDLQHDDFVMWTVVDTSTLQLDIMKFKDAFKKQIEDDTDEGHVDNH